MPIYEYRCRGCGQCFEIFVQSQKAAQNPECPGCHGTDLQKQFSSPAIMKAGRDSPGGTTCCGSTERCQIPPCTEQGSCRRDDE